MPMDIEWAVADGEITILQARPITSLPEPKPGPPSDVVWEPVAPNTVWMRRQIVEHMPEPLSPLFEDLYLKHGMHKSTTQLLQLMGEIGGATFDLDDLMPQGFATTINGFAYTTASFRVNRQALLAILQVYSKLFKFINFEAFNWDKVVLPEYQATITHWQSIDLFKTTDEALLRGISVLAAADSAYWFGSAVYLGLSRFVDSLFDRFLKIEPCSLCVTQASSRQCIVFARVRLQSAGCAGRFGAPRQPDQSIGIAARAGPRHNNKPAPYGIGRTS